MVTTERPKGITITVRDRKYNRSKSITVYNTTIEDVHRRIRTLLKKGEIR